LSSHLLSENVKVKIYETVILPAVFYGRETWPLTFREEHRFVMSGNILLRRIFGPMRLNRVLRRIVGPKRVDLSP
jgi:hypothetical protein